MLERMMMQIYKKVDNAPILLDEKNLSSIVVSYLPLYAVMFIYKQARRICVQNSQTNEQRSNIRTFVKN